MLAVSERCGSHAYFLLPQGHHVFCLLFYRAIPLRQADFSNAHLTNFIRFSLLIRGHVTCRNVNKLAKSLFSFAKLIDKANCLCGNGSENFKEIAFDGPLSVNSSFTAFGGSACRCW
jgi:hypothetical protein